MGAPPPIVAEPKSVLVVAPPSPGKCLAVAATPPRRQPSTAARVARAACCGSLENARLASAVPGWVGTSATGASVTLMPAAFRRLAAASASRPGSCDGLRIRRRRPGDVADHAALLVGAHDRRRARGAARRVEGLRERAQLLRGRDVLLEQDRARGPAVAQDAADVGRGGRALEAQDDELADLLAHAQAVDGLRRGRRVGRRRRGRLGRRARRRRRRRVGIVAGGRAERDAEHERGAGGGEHGRAAAADDLRVRHAGHDGARRRRRAVQRSGWRRFHAR